MLKWKRVFDGCWHGFQGDNPNPAVIVEQNDFGRKLWTVEVPGRGKIVDEGYDCFSFVLAKRVARSTLSTGGQHGRTRADQLVGGPDLN